VNRLDVAGRLARVRYAAAAAALAICSACDAGAAVAPSTASLNVAYVGRILSVNGQLVTAARLEPLPRYATIVPDLRAKSKFFEYVINDYGSYAAIFEYPKYDKQIGKIDDVGGQGCTNVLYGYGNKIFWIVASAHHITKYTVPKEPIKRLSVSIGKPSSCAMNAAGDLAVGILGGSRAAGDVVIFKNASGSGTVYTTPLTAEFFDGYDSHGNLFADGYNNSAKFQLVELPNGSDRFKKVTTSNTVGFPGSVQWDGKYLTVVDQDAASIYQYTVSGTTATLQGTVSLSTSSDCSQTWIATGVVYCADAGNEDGEVFAYPAGGSAIAVLGSSFPLPLGTVAAQR
jgi:hypothetical protein